MHGGSRVLAENGQAERVERVNRHVSAHARHARRQQRLHLSRISAAARRVNVIARHPTAAPAFRDEMRHAMRQRPRLARSWPRDDQQRPFDTSAAAPDRRRATRGPSCPLCRTGKVIRLRPRPHAWRGNRGAFAGTDTVAATGAGGCEGRRRGTWRRWMTGRRRNDGEAEPRTGPRAGSRGVDGSSWSGRFLAALR